MTRKLLAALALLALLARPAPAGDEGSPIPSGDRQARPSAAWVRRAVVYEVFTRSFSKEGSFKEVEKALPRLKQLGVTVVWLMPIHPTGKLNRKGHYGSPYAVQDYYAIDPQYGTPEDLRSLVRQAHSLGLRVIIDMVANHTAWDSVMMKADPGFYTHRDGRIVPPEPDWTDVADLDYGNPALRKYMTDMLVSWIRDYDLDGFRCDVANFIPLDFWEKARPELEKVKPEIIMIAEGDWPQDHLKAFDLTYSWRFYEAMIDVLSRGKPARWLEEVYRRETAGFPRGSLLMRFNDNHDKIRAVNVFGDEGALLTAGLTLTLPGVPMLYNGQEIGDPVPSNDPALFEKYDILWDNHVPRMRRFSDLYQGLLALRAQSPALREGTLRFLETDQPDTVLAYARSAGTDTVLVVANPSSRPVEVRLGDKDTEGAALPLADLRPAFPGAGEAAGGGTVLQLGPYALRVYRSPGAPAN